jgi:glycosyltransferase involved in cell wall biosynthesis
MDTALQYQVQMETSPAEQAHAVPSPVTHAPAPWLSIILPTRNEAGNIHLLLTRIEGATKGIPTEVIFVDDSTDETPRVIQEIADLFAVTTTVIVRPPEQRSDGLGGAVVAGLRAAQAPWVCVMDADLQHPPELIPQLLDRAQTANADVVLASRRTAESNAQGLSPMRQFISKSLDAVARVLFPSNLRNISDPLTGFFLARREAIEVDQLRPRGFKILLEILVRFPKLRVSEMPFDFGARHAGQSKASPNEVARYLSLLWTLRFGENWSQLFKFGVVGVTGIVVNTLVLALATDWLGIYFMVSTVIATLASTTWNFGLTEGWVFRGRQSRAGIVRRYGLFFVMNNLALALRGPVIYGLTTGLGLHYLWSNLISLAMVMLLRYVVADAWIWGKSQPKNLRPATSSRDSHVAAS